MALNAATETEHSRYARSAGIGIGVTNNPIAAFKQAYSKQSGQGSAGSFVGISVPLQTDGTAISAKTLNTKATSYTNNPKRITAQLNKYVDDMVNFKGDGKKGGLPITVRDISSREMYLAIPSNSTRQQMEAINKSLDYAKSQGVKIIVKEIK